MRNDKRKLRNILIESEDQSLGEESKAEIEVGSFSQEPKSKLSREIMRPKRTAKELCSFLKKIFEISENNENRLPFWLQRLDVNQNVLHIQIYDKVTLIIKYQSTIVSLALA